jgi:glycosyltransferase involved in cell wall biosynthesis
MGNELQFSVVVFAEPMWESKIWTNPQHIASRMARLHPVMYVQVPITPFHLFSDRGRRFIHRGYLWQPSHNLYVYTPVVLFPHPYRCTQILKYLDWINGLILSKQMLLVLRRLGFFQFPLVLWFFSPRLWRIAGCLQDTIVCYHCTDEYSAMPFSPTKQRRLQQEEYWLIRKSDLVFTTALTLYERKKKDNPNTYYAPNAADVDHFAYAEKVQKPKDLQGISSPIIGFIGAIDKYKVDFALLEFLATTHPNWNFVMIGPIGNMDNTSLNHIPRAPNIYYLGHRDYNELPDYVSCFDVCVIPYSINEYTETVFPLKFFEYLAAGRPVVSTDLPALREFENVAYISKTKEDFAANIQRALLETSLPERERQSLLQQRLAVAKSNSWDARVQMLLETISTYLASLGDGGYNV